MEKDKKILINDLLKSNEIEESFKTKINLYVKNKPDKEIKFGILNNFINNCDKWAKSHRSFLKESKKFEKENEEIRKINEKENEEIRKKNDEKHREQIRIYDEKIKNIFGFQTETKCNSSRFLSYKCNRYVFQRLDISFPFTLGSCKDNHSLYYWRTTTLGPGSTTQKNRDHYGQPCSFVHKEFSSHLEWQEDYFSKNAKKKSVPSRPIKPKPKLKTPKLKKAKKPTRPVELLTDVHFNKYRFTYLLIILIGILIGVIFYLI